MNVHAVSSQEAIIPIKAHSSSFLQVTPDEDQTKWIYMATLCSPLRQRKRTDPPVAISHVSSKLLSRDGSVFPLACCNSPWVQGNTEIP